METYLKELAMKIKIELSDEQLEKFFCYKNLLIERNKFVNLTAITEDKDVILKHFIDSLTINSYIAKENVLNGVSDTNRRLKLIDVGTGAGFPGIPIKIIREDVDVTLLDSLNKRLNFLNDVTMKLDLKDIRTIHGRAEDVARNRDFRECFDFATARAVANLSTLVELCLPFVRVGGSFICMKGTLDKELSDARKAIDVLGGEVVSDYKFLLPDSDIERNIILIKKVKNTPEKYPRKAGTPAKEPIS